MRDPQGSSFLILRSSFGIVVQALIVGGLPGILWTSTRNNWSSTT
jgi:hypothetical protein